MDIDPSSSLKGKLINQLGEPRLKGSLVSRNEAGDDSVGEVADTYPKLRGSLAATTIAETQIYINRDSGPWELFDRTVNSQGYPLLRLRSLTDGATVNIRESRLEDVDTPWKKAE